jgi:5-formyltetrahydrofolate cyclo-ligase
LFFLSSSTTVAWLADSRGFKAASPHLKTGIGHQDSPKVELLVLEMANPDLDEPAYEKDWLEKDAQAMEAMKELSENEFSKLRTPWKWEIRKRIWDMMEEKDIARSPRPVHHRIPNFAGAEQAAARLATLPEFQSARIVKVNPDTPQRPVRHLVLEQGKTLLTPQPRLRTGFFSTVKMDQLPSLVKVEECTVSKGVVKWGTSVTLKDKYTVDLVVV